MLLPETKRTYLREWVQDDWVRIKTLATDPRVLRYLTSGAPWDEGGLRLWVRHCIKKNMECGYTFWPVIHKAKGRLIGWCGFGDAFSPDKEIGWRFHPKVWGRGLATEVARAVLELGFRELRFPRVVAVAMPENRASIRVMEKLGMMIEEHFDHRGHTVVRYGIDNPYRKPSSSSVPITIRHATLEDAARIAAIYNEAVLTTTASFDTEPKSEADRRAWLAQHGERYPVLVAVREGEIVGFGSLSPWSDRQAYSGTAETSFYVAEAHRGLGIGRVLKGELIREARAAGMHTLLARVAEGSEASLHLNLAMGFELLGTMREVGHKHGQWLDVHVLQLMLE